MFPIIEDKRFAVPFEADEVNSNFENIQLKKVKVSGEDVEVRYEALVYNHDDQTRKPAKYTFEPGIAAHEDLVKCFRRLAAHYALIATYVDRDLDGLELEMSGELSIRPAALEKISVSSVIFSGKDSNDENRGVQLVGRKDVLGGLPMNSITPLIKLDDSKKNYPYQSELDDLIEDLKIEVKLYLGGKQAPAAQTQIGFSGNEEEEERPVVKKKKEKVG